ncbi:leukotoxin LktA family filamentous adhesin [Aquabacterium lacunae]|nr:leukotoxin LktA family filamentous adhesin [Aquabacterium lacunae]
MTKPRQRRTLTVRAATRKAAMPQPIRRPAWGKVDAAGAVPKPLPMALAVASAMGLAQSALAADNTITVMQKGGANVTGTQVQVNGNRTNITTTTISGNAAFNAFSRFDVAAGNTVNLVVPTAVNTLVNLVSNPISINGTLNSVRNGTLGGHLVFASPDGMVVGASGVVNTARLSVFTPNRTDFDALTGAIGSATGDSLTAQLMRGEIGRNATGFIRVLGQINALDGVTLDAGGNVTVEAGAVIRAGSDARQAATLTAAVNASGSGLTLPALVKVGGDIEIVSEADVVVANTAQVSAAQRLDPVTADEAAQGAGRGGNVKLVGRTVTVAGSVDASGQRRGGTVQIGQRDTSRLAGQGEFELAKLADASFDESLEATETSTLNVDGSYSGPASAYQATRAKAVVTRSTTLASTGQVLADALTQGDGGRVDYVSETSNPPQPGEGTSIAGRTSARGTGAGGQGGSVGYEGLGATGWRASAVTDLSAGSGAALGTLTLGAYNIRIVDGAASAGVGCLTTCDITIGTIQSLMGTANLTLVASNPLGTSTLALAEGVNLDLRSQMGLGSEKVLRLQSQDITLQADSTIQTRGGRVILSGLGSLTSTIPLFEGTPIATQQQIVNPVSFNYLGGSFGGNVTMKSGSRIITRPVATGQDATTAATLQGKAGDVILRGENIDLQAGSGIYAQGDGVRQGGTVELSTYSAANHYLVVSNANSSLTLGGTVRAGTINATSMAYAAAAGTEEKFAMQALAFLGGVSAGVEIAKANATTTVKSTAVLQADGDLNLNAQTTTSALNKIKAINAGTLQSAVTLSAAYAETGGEAKTVIEGGSITAGGALNVLALNNATARSKVSSISLAGAPMNAAFSMVKTDNKATADVQGGTIKAAKVDIQALQVGDTYNAVAIKKISADGDSDGVSVAAAVSQTKFSSEAKLGANLIGVGDVNVLANTVTWQNYNKVAAKDGKLPAIVQKVLAKKGKTGLVAGNPVMQYVAGQVDAALKRQNTRGQFDLPFQASGTVAFVDSELNANAVIAPNVTIDSTGNVAVVGRTENHSTHNISQAGAKAKDDVGFALSAAVAVGLYEQNADTTIGQNVTIKAQNIGVLAETEQPLDVTWEDQFDIRNKPAKILKAITPPNFGLADYVLTSYASAKASQTVEGGAAITGSVNYTSFSNSARAWIAPKATLEAKAASDTPWTMSWKIPEPPPAFVDPLDNDNLVVPPAGQIEATKSLLCAFEANPQQCRQDATLPPDKVVMYGVFPADVPPPVLGITPATSVAFDRSLSVDATSETMAITLAGSAAGLIPQPGAKGENSAGASVNVLSTDHRVSALVDASATLKANATVSVQASADDTLVALTPSGGKAEDTGVSLLGAVILTDNKVRALVDSTAQLAARNVILDARQGLTAVNVAAALTSGGAVSVGVGLSLADVYTDTQARVGLGVGTSESWLRPAGVAVTPFAALAVADQGIRISDTLTVDAQTQAMIVSLGVMASDTSNDDPNTYEGPAKKPSAAAALKQKATDKISSTRTALAEKLKTVPKVGNTLDKTVRPKQKEPPKGSPSAFNLALTANAAVNNVEMVTKAGLDDVTVKARNPAADNVKVTVNALEQANIAAASGAGALSRGKDPAVTTKAGGSGALALNIVRNTTEASVRGSTIQDFSSMNVLADRRGENVTVGLGLAASSGSAQQDAQSLQAAVSASVTDVDSQLTSVVERSTLTGRQGAKPTDPATADLQVLARDSTTTGVGGGALSIGGSKGVGATVAVGLIKSDTTAAIRGSQVTQVNNVRVGAFDPTTMASAAVAVTVSSGQSSSAGVSIAGSAAVNFVNTTTVAEITDAPASGLKPKVRSSITADGDVSVVASDQVTTQAKTAFDAAYAAHAAGAPRGEADADVGEDRSDFGAGFLANKTSDGKSSISAQREVPEGETDSNNPAVTWDTARAGSLMIAVTGTGVGQGNGAGVGVSVSVSEKSHIARAYDADLTANKLDIAAKASTLAVDVAVGAAVSTDTSNFSGVGSAAATSNGNVTEARLGKSGTTTNVTLRSKADDALQVRAEDDTQNWTVAGNVAVNMQSGAAIGLALGVSESTARTEAIVERAKVVNTGGNRVTASSDSDFFTLAISGGYAAGVALNGSVTYDDIASVTKAEVRDGSDISGSSLSILAGDTSASGNESSRIFSLAGTGAKGGTAIGAGININIIRMSNQALMSDSTFSIGSGGILQRARSNAEIWAAAVSVGVGDNFAFNGASANSAIENVTLAESTGVNLDTDGNYTLAAEDDSASRTLSLGLAASTGGGAGGAAITVNHMGTQTRASLHGDTTDANAKVQARNVKVTADSDGTVGVLAVGIGGASTGAVGGSIGVNVMTNRIVAEIDQGAKVDADNNVLVRATDKGDISALAGGVAVSASSFSAALGASASANVIQNSTRASIGNDGEATTVVNARAQDRTDTLEVANGDLTEQVTYDGFTKAENYAAPTLTQATKNVTGVAVNASSVRHVKAMGLTVGLAASLGGGFAGNIGAQVAGGDTTARITNSRLNFNRQAIPGVDEADQVLHLGETGTAQNVDILAASHQYSANFAFAGSGSGIVAASGAVSVDVNVATTVAELRNSEVDAGGVVGVQASSTGGMAGSVASVAGAGGLAGAGTVEVGVSKGTTRAGVYDSEVHAAGVAVNARNLSGNKFVVGSGAIAGGYAGAGSVLVAVSEQTTTAEIDQSRTGSRAGQARRTVRAESKGIDHPADGQITVDAVNDVRNGNVVVALAGGSDVGVAGVIDVTVHNSTTQARVRDANLEASGRSGDTTRGVRVKAEDKGNILRAAGAAGISFGSAGASGAVSLMIGRSSAQATVTDSVVDAPVVTVEALNRKQLDNYAIGLGVGGGAGVGGTLSLVMLGTAPASQQQPAAFGAFTGNSKGGSSIDAASGATSGLNGVFSVDQSSPGKSGRSESALTSSELAQLQGASSTSTDMGSLLSSGRANEAKALVSNSVLRTDRANVVAQTETSIINAPGALGAAGAVGVGGSIGLTFVNNAVEAGLSRSLVMARDGGARPTVTVSAVADNLSRGSSHSVKDGSTQIDCGKDTTVCAVSVAGGAGGLVGFGAAVAHVGLNNQVSTHVDGDLTVGSLALTSEDNSKVDVFTLGASVGAVAVGASSATAVRDGAVTAQINPDRNGAGESFSAAGTAAGLRGARVQASELVSVTAHSGGVMRARAIGLAAGAAGATGAGTGLTDNISTTARIGNNALVSSASGNIALSARHDAALTADSLGVAVASWGALGVSASTAVINSQTTAEIDDGAQVLARTTSNPNTGTTDENQLSVEAVDTSSASSKAVAGTGALLVGANAAVADTTQKARTHTRLGDQVTLGSGLLSLSANSNVSGSSVATGISVGGLLSVGAAISRTHAQTDTTLAYGLGTRFEQVNGNEVVGARASLSAKGQSNLISRTLAGSGGIVSGAAASSAIDDTGRASVTLADGSGSATNAHATLAGHTVEVVADYMSSYGMHANAVNASVVGASGTEAIYTNNANGRKSGATIDVGRYGEVEALDGISLTAASHVQRVPGTESPTDGDAMYVATGAGGGLISGAAVIAKQTLNHEAATRIGDNASLVTSGDPYLRKGNIAVHARTTTDAAMHVKLNTGGAIQAPFTKSETFLNTQVTATLGQNVLVRSSGSVGLTTSVDHKVLSEAVTKTYGAIGIAGGRSVTELIANETVGIGSGSDVFAWDNVSIGSGMDAQGAAINLLGARSITDVYNYAIIPITPELDAEASAVDRANVTVSNGARVRSVRDVRIGSRRGLSDAKTVAAGHNPYSESTHEVINEPGKELVKYEHGLTVDGQVLAGVRSTVKVNVSNTNNLTYRVEDGSGDSQVSIDPLLAEGGMVTVGSINALGGNAPNRVFVKTTLNAKDYLLSLMNATSDNEEAERLGNLAALVNPNTLDTFVLPDLRAYGGSIKVDADTINGRGVLRASGGATIDIQNAGNNHLFINNLLIPDAESGGHVDFVRGQLRDKLALSVQEYATDRQPLINIRSNYVNPQGGKSGTIFFVPGRMLNGQTSQVSNLQGRLAVQTDYGDIAITSAVSAAEILQDAPQGAVSQGTPNTPFFTGGDPAYAWQAAVSRLSNPASSWFFNFGEIFPSQIALMAAREKFIELVGREPNSTEELSRVLASNGDPNQYDPKLGYSINNDQQVWSYVNNGVNFGQIAGKFGDDSPAAYLRWYKNRYLFTEHALLSPTASSTTLFAGDNANNPTVPTGINGGQLLQINASILDLNGKISSGVSGSNSVTVRNTPVIPVGEVKISVLDCLLDPTCVARNGLSDYRDPVTGMYRLDTMTNGVTSVKSGDRAVPIWFDTASRQLVTRSMTGGNGGRILLSGQIINSSRLDGTGRTNALIQLNSGAPQFDIQNLTGFNLSLGSINTGDLGKSELRITDKLRRDGQGRALTTWYVYDPAAGGRQGFTQYQAYGANLREGYANLSGNYLGQSNTLAYNPVDGARLNWTRSATIGRTVYNPVANSNAWWDWRATEWQYTSGWSNNGNYSVSVNPGDRDTTIRLSMDTTEWNRFSTGVGYSYNGPAERYFNLPTSIHAVQSVSVKADTPIPIRAAGASEGLINVLSLGGITLEGSLTNRTGRTDLTDRGTGIRQGTEVDPIIAARQLNISSTRDVGAAPDQSGLRKPVRIDMTTDAQGNPLGTLRAEVTNGSLFLDAVGPVRVERLSSQGTTWLHAAGSISTANGGPVFGQMVDLVSTNGSITGDNVNQGVNYRGGILSAKARGDIRIDNQGDVLRINEVASAEGEVALTSASGMRDAREEVSTEFRSEDEIQALWNDRLQMTDQAGALADAQKHTITPYQQRVRTDYDTWWALMDAGSVDASGQFTVGKVTNEWRTRTQQALNLAAAPTDQQVRDFIVDTWRTRARSAQGLDSNASLSAAEVQGYVSGLYASLSSRFDEAYGGQGWKQQGAFQSYNRDFAYDMAVSNQALRDQLVRGAYWGTDLLTNQIRSAALARTATETPLPSYTNVSGRKVTLSTGTGTSVGRYVQDLAIPLYNADGSSRKLSAVELQALLQATSPNDLTVVKDANGKPISFVARQNRPVIVSATEALKVTAGIDAIVSARGQAKVDSVTANTGQVRFTAEDGILRVGSGATFSSGSGGMILNAGRGSIGTFDPAQGNRAVLISSTRPNADIVLEQVRAANGEIRIERADAGDVQFDEITAAQRAHISVAGGDLLARDSAVGIVASELMVKLPAGRFGAVADTGKAVLQLNASDADGTLPGLFGFQVRDDVRVSLAPNKGVSLVGFNQGGASVASQAAAFLLDAGTTPLTTGPQVRLAGEVITTQDAVVQGDSRWVVASGRLQSTTGQVRLDVGQYSSAGTAAAELQAAQAVRVRASEGDIQIGNVSAQDIALDAPVGRIVAAQADTNRLTATRLVDLNGGGAGQGIGESVAKPLTVAAPTVAASSAAGNVYLRLLGDQVTAQRLSAPGGVLDVTASKDLLVRTDVLARSIQLQAAGLLDSTGYSVRSTLAEGDLFLKAGRVVADRVLHDNGTVRVEGTQGVNVSGLLQAGTEATITSTNGDVSVTALQAGGNASLVAGGALSVGNAQTGQSLSLKGVGLVKGDTLAAGTTLDVQSTEGNVALGQSTSVGNTTVTASKNVTFNAVESTAGSASLQAGVDLTGTTLKTSQDASVTAGRDLSLTTLQAGRKAALVAGGALTVGNGQSGQSLSLQGVGLVKGDTLSAGTTLDVQSTEGNVALGQSTSVGNTTVTASKNVTFNAVESTAGSASLQAGVDLTGTTLKTAQDASVTAGRDLSLTTLQAGRKAALVAGGALSVGNGQTGQSLSLQGVGLVKGDTLAAGTTLDMQSTEGNVALGQSTSVGNTTVTASKNVTFNAVESTAGSASLQAGVDLTGTTLKTAQDASVTAGRDLSLTTLQAGGKAALVAGGALSVGNGQTGQSLSLQGVGLVKGDTLSAGTTLDVQSTEGNVALGQSTSVGNTTVVASKNVTFNAVESTAGSASLQAGVDLTGTTLKTAQDVSVTAGRNLSLTTLQAGGNASLAAGADLSIEGLQVAGRVDAQAGGDMNGNTWQVGQGLTASMTDGRFGTLTADDGDIVLEARRDLTLGVVRVNGADNGLRARAGRNIAGQDIRSAGYVDMFAGGTLSVVELEAPRVRLESIGAMTLDVLRADRAELLSATELLLKQGRIGSGLSMSSPRMTATVQHTRDDAPLDFRIGGYGNNPVIDLATITLDSAQPLRVPEFDITNGTFRFNVPSFRFEGMKVGEVVNVYSQGLRTLIDNLTPRLPIEGIDLTLYEPTRRFMLMQQPTGMYTTAYAVAGRVLLPVFIGNYTFERDPVKLNASGTTVITVNTLLPTYPADLGFSRQVQLADNLRVDDRFDVALEKALSQPTAAGPAVQTEESEEDEPLIEVVSMAKP